MQLPKIEKHEEKTKKIISSKSSSNMQKKAKLNVSRKRSIFILAIILLLGIFALLLNTRLGDTIKENLATAGIIGESKASNLDETSDLSLISEPSSISDEIYNAGISTLAGTEIHWDGDWGVSVGNVIIYGGSETDDGGLITGGMFSGTFNFGNGVSITSKGNSDGFVVKYNSDKEAEWAKSYGGNAADWIYTMDLASDGGYVVAGDFMSSQLTIGNNTYTNATAPSGATTGAYSNDGIVIKYTRNGSISWSSHISGSGSNLIDEIITTNDNGALVSLITNSSDLTVDGISVSGSSARLMIIKYDSNGNYQWSKQLGNGSFPDITSIFQNSNGEYLVTGEIYNNLQLSNGQNISNQGGYDGIVIKCDSNGNINFAKAIGGSATDVINSAVYTDDGGILVGGRFYSSSISLGNGYTLQNSGETSTSDGFVVKYDKNGNVEWSKSIGNSGADSIDMVLVRDDGKIIVGGSFNGSINLGNGITVTSKGSSDILLVQLSDEGNVELAKVIGGSSSDTVEKMRETRDGGILITGRTTSSSIDLENGETVNGTGGILIKVSQYIEEKIDVQVTKQWNDSNNSAGKRPSALQIILKNGNQEVDRQQINSSTGWACTFSNLQKNDDNGNEINYTVTEEEINQDDLKFYSTGTVTGSIEQGFTITNTFSVPNDTVSVKVTKNWVDTLAQRDKRPSQVTVQVSGGGTTRSYNLKSSENWTYTFTGLPKYNSYGNEINYTVQETSTNQFYEQTSTTGSMSSGYTITNTFTRPTDTISLTVNKVWDDNYNQAGKRPSSVNIVVTGNGSTYRRTINSSYAGSYSNIWTVTFTGLPKYDNNGDEINYTVDEENLSSIFYTKEGVTGNISSGYTITNTFEVPDDTIQISATKVWDDNYNQAGKRPSSITLKLTGNGNTYRRTINSSSDRTTITFTGLPKYNSLGNEINYTLSEESTGSIFYTAENTDISGSMEDGFTVTNEFVVPNDTVSVKVTKSWVDTAAQQDKRPSEVTVVLKNGTSEVRSIELNSSNGWTYTFTNLPKYNNLGNEINYTVEEETTNKFYTSSVSGNMTNGYVITNTFEVPDDTVQVTVDKVWDDNRNEAEKRPDSVTLKVTGNEKSYTQEVTAANSLDDENIWSYTFTNLPKYDDNGNEIDYIVDEEDINIEFYLKSVDQAGNKITNTFQVPGENVNIRVTKVWDDNDNLAGKRPQNVTLQIKNGNSVVASEVVDSEDNWTHEFTVPKYDSLGNEINYTADEANLGNIFYTSENKEISGSMSSGFTITNSFVVPDEKVSVNVSKVWVDTGLQQDKRPSQVTVILKNGDSEVQRIELNSGSEWKGKFNDLSRYDSLGNEINYTIEEVSTNKFYTSSISGNMANGFVITNTFERPNDTVEVTVNKFWNDNNNEAGKRPENVTLKVTGNGQTYKQEVNSDNIGENNNTWTYTFTNLLKYDANGNEIAYTADEEDLGNKFYVKGTLAGSMEGGFTITNIFQVPDEKVEVPVTKIWDDSSNSAGKRPSSVTLKLTGSDGQDYTGQLSAANVESDNSNNWTYTFRNLPKYDNLGNEVEYTLSEESTGSIFYTPENAVIDQENKTITNKFIVPNDTIQVPVTKIWDDNSNNAGKRPDSVTVKLTGNGREYTRNLTATNEDSSNSNNWTYTFTNLPKYDDRGDEITYTLSEESTGSIFYTAENTNITGSTAEGYTVTNKFVVPDEKVSVKISKTWVDTAEQEDKRSAGVTVVIKNGENEAARQELNSSNGWTYTFTNLPKYNNLGNEINYTVEEETTNIFYTSSVEGDMTNGYVITNTFERPEDTVEVTVNKVWADNNDEADKRPESVTLKVFGNGEIYTQEVTSSNSVVGDTNTWEYTFTNLPKYDENGDEIEYTVDEEDINSEFYLKSVDQVRNTITNTFQVPGENVNIRVTKVWDDNENLAGKRPSIVTLQIKNGESVVASQSVSAENGWTYEFTVPKYDSLGNEINYTADEANLGNIFYTEENKDIAGNMTEGYTITNRFVVPDEKVSVDVRKVWVDTGLQQDKRSEQVEVILKNGELEIQRKELNSENEWKETFTDLSRYDSLGNEINYTIEEETTNKFYTSSISGNMNDGYVITNIFERPEDTVEVTVNKVWADNNDEADKRPESVTLKVSGNGEIYTQEVTSSNSVAGDTNKWAYTFTNLPKYDENGDKIEYTVDEENLNSEFYLKSVDQETNTVTNTFQVPGENVQIRVTKVWDDNENEARKRPSNVTLQIKNGESLVTSEVVDTEDNWTYEFTVPKYDSLGNEINYTADEADLGNKFYTKTEITGSMTDGFNVTNKFEVPDERIEIPVTKVWDDNDNIAGKRPTSVTLKLTGSDGQEYTQTLTTSNTNPDNSNNWEYTFTNLPKYDDLGNEVVYTLSEEPTESIFYTEQNTVINQENKTITNTFVVPDDKISVDVTKVWDDNSNIAEKRPTSVTLKLTGNDQEYTQTLTAANADSDNSNNWTYIFTNLPKYDDVGDEINYTLSEDPTESIFYTEENTDITGNMEEGYTVTNTFVVPDEKVTVDVSKVWVDTAEQQDKRPSQVTVVLKNGVNEVRNEELNNANGWAYTFTNLPKYNDLGNEINYTVEEETTNKFYTSSISGSMTNGYVITNTFERPEDTVEVTVNKVWADNNDEADKRPESVTLKVSGNGETYTQEVTSSNSVAGDTNKWTYTFTNLSKYDENGDEIEYTVDEENLNSEFYLKSVDQETNTVTNTFQVPGENVNIRVTKVWDDNENFAGKRPSNVTLQIKNGESVVSSEVVNVGDNWTHEFTVPKYDLLGNEINYTADEANLGNIFYTEENKDITGNLAEGYTITNRFVVPDEKVSVDVTKVWDDNENEAGKRPTSVTVKLTGSDGQEHTQTLTTSNADPENTYKWIYTFENLPKYDSKGNEITYILSEEPTESIFYTAESTDIKGDMNEGFVVINTFVVPDDKVTVDVNKVWVDTAEQQDKRSNQVTVVLKNGASEAGRQELNSSNNWSYTFTNLPKYNDLGNEINYTVEEVTVNKFYTSSISGDMTSGYVVTNTFVRPDDTIELPVTKIWSDNNNETGKRSESITLKVTGNGQEYTQEVTKENQTENANTWSYTFTNLPKYDGNGDEIEYIVDEENLENEFYLKSVDQKTDTITNTFQVPGENVNIRVTKVWDDNENIAGKRPSNVTLQIKNGESVVASEVIDAEDNWTHEFAVPKYDSLGNEINYTADEANIGNKFYTEENKDIAGSMTEGYTITNTFVVPDEKVSVNVSKTWVDNEKQEDKRTSEVTVILKNGEIEASRQELNNSNDWNYTFTELSKYNELGNEINYTVEEVTTNKFYTSNISGDMTNGYEITNTFTRPTDTVDVTITKTWDHTNNIYEKPHSVVLQVKNRDEVVAEQTVTSDNAISDNENIWSYTFTGLDKYDENGDEIVYTAGEAEVQEGDLDYYTSESSGTNITNTYNGPVISQSKSIRTENERGYVVEGEKITYTITVRNDGGVEKDVIVQDTVPEGTRFVEGSVKVSDEETAYSSEDLNSGITVKVKAKSESRVSFEVTVDELEEGTYLKEIRNTGVVDGQNTNEIVVVVNKSNLMFEQTSDPTNGSQVKTGEEITYTITLKNAGTLTIDGIVRDNIPKGTSFVEGSIKINDAETEYTEEDLTESGIRIPVGASEEMTLSFKVKVGDLNNGETIGNVAIVNDTSTNEVTHKYIEAEITSLKNKYTENGLDYVVTGEKIIYMIIAKNSGGLDKNVTIKDSIPEGTTFVEESIKVNSLTTYNEQDLTQLTTEDLRNGITLNVPAASSTGEGFVRLSFAVTVNEDATGEIRNIGTVDEVETNEVIVPVVTTEKFSSVIRHDESSTLTDNQVTVNDEIRYTIRVTNTGTTTVNGVEVKDSVPDGTKLISIENEGIQEDEEIIWNIASIGEGETKEVSFIVKVEYAKENYSIRNSATVDEKQTNEVENPYVKLEPVVESTLEKNGTDIIISKNQVVNYEIKFTANVDDFKGTAKVTLVDTLPYGIDISSSKLANGTYNPNDRTITWEQEFDVDTFETDEAKNIVITKAIEIVYLYDDIDAITGSMINTVDSKVELVEDGEIIFTEENEQNEEKETTISIPTEVIVHHYIYDTETDTYTTIKLSPDERIDGVIGQDYMTSKSSQVPNNYNCVNEQPENYIGKMTEETIEVNYYYSLITPTVTNNIDKTASADTTEERITESIDGSQSTTVVPVLTKEEGEVIYNIRYTAQINNYIGKATFMIVDTLPCEIDIEKSELLGGTYNSTYKTITWEEEINDVNTYTKGTYNYEFERTIKLVYEGQNKAEDIVNNIVGRVNLYYPENHSSNPGKVQVTENATDTEIVGQDYKVDIEVEKVWDDENNLKGHRPEGINVTIAGGNIENIQVELNEGNNWRYEVIGLDKYDDHGNKINYSVAESEKNKGDLKYYTARLQELSTNDPSKQAYRLTNTYKLTQSNLEASITKTGTEEITASSDEVSYEINFTSTIKEYIGDGKVIITDTLPYKIDVNKSNLNGGTYDEEVKTITWEEDIRNIDTFENGDYEINITKNISVVFADLDASGSSFTNTVIGKVRLYETEQEDQTTANTSTLININGDVIVKYVDIDTGEEISERVTLSGKVGEKYTTSRKQIENYDYVRSTPNTEGLIPEGIQEVTYYYQRKAAQVIVKYQDMDGNTLAEDVVINGKVGDSYITEQKEFEGHEFVSVTENASGTMTEETIIVIYTYEKIPAKVIVQYLEKDTNQILALEDEILGYVGDSYTTDRKIIKNYQSADPEPENKTGVMTEETITVIYYYEKIPSGDVIVKYVDIDTDEDITYKLETGEEEIYGYTINGFVGDSYTTEQKDIPYYNFIKSTSNTTGQLTEAGDTVIYYYQKQKFNLGITKSISEITLDGASEGVGDGKTTKVEIHRKKIDTANLEVKYKIVVSNTEEISGTAKVVDVIPVGYTVSNNNPTYWTTNAEGNLETTVELQPGETKELEVVLKWVNGEMNFGTSENIARITDISNPANYVETTIGDNEDKVNLVTSVETGINRDVYLIITTYLLMIDLVVLLYLYQQYQKERKEEITPRRTLKLKLPDDKK